MISRILDAVKLGSTEVIKRMIEKGEVTPETRLEVGLRSFPVLPLTSLLSIDYIKFLCCFRVIELY